MKPMIGCLPLVTLVLLTSVFRKRGHRFREAVLYASVLWGGLVVVVVEFASLFRLLDSYVVGVFWGLVGVAALLAWSTTVGIRPSGPVSQWEESKTLAPTSMVMLAWLAFIALFLGVICLSSSPNTYDSMTYHMSRVMHWIQNRSVEHYPTNILRQLFLSPWAEYAILQFQALSGSDRLAGIIQYLSMLGCLVGVSLLSEELGGRAPDQILAAVIVATIPMGILQATGTQNDYVVSFWLVCFVALGLQVTSPGTRSALMWRSAGAGAALGLSVLTKPTAYACGAPFALWFVIAATRTRGREAWKAVLIVALVALGLNLGHWSRNIQTFGFPLAPQDYTAANTNETWSPQALLSNLVRHLSLHLGTPVTAINREIESAIQGIHSILGLDVNDSRTTFSAQKFRVDRTSLHEDGAGNPLHLLLIALTFGSIALRPSSARGPLLTYSLCVAGGLALLIALIKWNPWNSRYHLPVFVLSAPLVAVQLKRIGGQRFATLTAIILLILSLGVILLGKPRPLLGRQSVLTADSTDQYFANMRELETSYKNVCREVRLLDARRVGLALCSDCWEYPFWALLNRDSGRAPVIEHVCVDKVGGGGITTKARGGVRPPDCIVSSLHDGMRVIETEFGLYQRTWTDGRLSLYTPVRR